MTLRIRRSPSSIDCVRSVVGMNVSAELTGRAIDKLRRNETLYGVAAIFVGQCSPPDQDGVSWRFVVADPSRTDTLLGTVSGSQGGYHDMPVDEKALEAEVEQIAGSFAVETRLDDLVAASPLTLMREG
jgi:hypothetical protein